MCTHRGRMSLYPLYLSPSLYLHGSIALLLLLLQTPLLSLTHALAVVAAVLLLLLPLHFLLLYAYKSRLHAYWSRRLANGAWHCRRQPRGTKSWKGESETDVMRTRRSEKERKRTKETEKARRAHSREKYNSDCESGRTHGYVTSRRCYSFYSARERYIGTCVTSSSSPGHSPSLFPRAPLLTPMCTHGWEEMLWRRRRH